MIRNILVILMVFFTLNAFAQDNTGEMTRKEMRKAKLEQDFRETKEMLENRNFVLESDYLQNKYGHRIPVSSTINFVMVSGETAVIQIGSNHGLGANGVGGVTAKGRITSWEFDVNEKKKTFNLEMNVNTPIGNYDVSFFISPSGQATANLSGLHPGRLTFDGDVVTLNESVVYEGNSI